MYNLSDCFQREELTKFPSIGECLVNALGAVICGSQVVRYVAEDVLLTMCAYIILKVCFIYNYKMFMYVYVWVYTFKP